LEERTRVAALNYEEVVEAAEHLRRAGFGGARVGVILGSGLGGFADTLSSAAALGYGEIPGFVAPKVLGHAGRLVTGALPGGERVLAMQGRAHYYEGHPLARLVFPVRVMAALGVRALVITNAAGGIAERFSPGDLVLIRDHLNLMGENPLRGPNDERIGKRFPDMTYAYSPTLLALAREAAAAAGVELKEGVYAAMSGPSYETPAEIRMLRALGADMVGMSTVPEVIAAAHAGVATLGISCVTNYAAGVTATPIDHGHVEEVAARSRERFTALVSAILSRLCERLAKEPS
jgi:purine-nucleoside phosphorylase